MVVIMKKRTVHVVIKMVEHKHVPEEKDFIARAGTYLAFCECGTQLISKMIRRLKMEDKDYTEAEKEVYVPDECIGFV